MIKKLTIIIILFWMPFTYAQINYLARFMAYQEWSHSLPEQPTEEFLKFISEDTPLARKLREKWLYHLASQKNWKTFLQYYQPSNDISLQCLDLQAEYNAGPTDRAIHQAQVLWLTGESRPPACNLLFSNMLKNGQINDKLISTRIRLALDKSNLGLARYLLRQFPHPRLADIDLLNSIYQKPEGVIHLNFAELHDEFYLYGLKRLVSLNMKKAIQYWQLPMTIKFLSEAQQQSFLIHLVIYKAMRNHEDIEQWFRQIKPSYYTDTLLDWQIRAALKLGQWKRVIELIDYSPNKESPCWQYWLARALEAEGQSAKAEIIYQSLAAQRNYYGFLASSRLKIIPNMSNEKVVTDQHLLRPYQSFLISIKDLYFSKHALEASRLLNDFILELPKEDKSALIHWLASDLQWHAKSVYLSNTEELNNQLSLRFPLAHQNEITNLAHNYHIPSEFVYAIIRQESCFREDVVSFAGARGLMQLMPDTARMVAKQEKIPYADKAQLFLANKNINLGVAYLKQLARRYHAHPLLIAAAYNAGPRQVNYWLKNHPPEQIDIWIETLPWHETRNYLKNIVSFYLVYQYRMKLKPDISAFMRDLHKN